MKKVIIAIVLLIILDVGLFVLRNKYRNIEVSILPSPTASQPSKTVFCNISQLKTTFTPEGAAGNVYTTLTIKNTSTSACQIVGNNQLKVEYPISIKNLRTDQKDTPKHEYFTLAPGQIVYSLIHFPNGPQCSSKATDVNAMVSYQISTKDSVSFTPEEATTVSIPSCGEESELTIIDLYSFSDKEVLPQ